MVRRLLALLALNLMLWVAAPVAAKQPPIDYQEPPPDPPAAGQIDHAAPGQTASPPLPDRLVAPGAFQQLPAIDESRWVVLAVNRQPYWSFGKLDPVLTEACRLNDFVSLPLNRIVMQFSGDRGRALMQVVPPLYRHLLVDSRNLARPGATYYFYNNARADCEVRVDAGSRVGAFPVGRGTALPPADPRAIAKRKALIKSWPKSTS